MRNMLTFFVLGISICETLAQTCIKYYHVTERLPFILLAFVLYGCVAYLLSLAYDYKGVGLVNVLWSGMTVLMMLAIGIFGFHEQIHIHDWIGIFLIVLGMIVININNVHTSN